MMLQVNSEFLWGRCGLPESRTPRRESSEASLGAAKEDVGTVFQGHRHNTLNGRPYSVSGEFYALLLQGSLDRLQVVRDGRALSALVVLDRGQADVGRFG